MFVEVFSSLWTGPRLGILGMSNDKDHTPLFVVDYPSTWTTKVPKPVNVNPPGADVPELTLQSDPNMVFLREPGNPA